MRTRNTILIIMLAAAVVALLFTVFDLPWAIGLLPWLGFFAVLGWRFVRLVEAAEPELERRLIAWHYARLARRALRLMQHESEG